MLFEAGDAEGLKNEIWIYDLTRQSWTLVAQAHAVNALWSPDGQTVVYSSNENGPYNLFTVPADASTPPRQLTHHQNWPFASSWSPDGRYLAVWEQTEETASDIWIVDTVTGRQTPFAVTGAAEREAVFSPDGRWIAHEEWLFPRPYVVVRPFPGPGPKQQVSVGESGRRPIWIDNDVLYWSQGAVFAVDAKSGPRLVLGKPRQLFKADFGPDAFDVTPDGKRFLAIREKSETRFDHLNVVRGWWLEGGS